MHAPLLKNCANIGVYSFLFGLNEVSFKKVFLKNLLIQNTET